MAWVAVDKNKDKWIYDIKPSRDLKNIWWCDCDRKLYMPAGSIKKLIGKELTWDDEPVEIT